MSVKTMVNGVSREVSSLHLSLSHVGTLTPNFMTKETTLRGVKE